MDANTTLASIKSQVAQFAHERDWEQFHAPKNLSMAIAAEAAELMEHYLWCSAEDSKLLTATPGKNAAVADELADVLILTLQFANMAGVDVTTAIARKLEANRVKYPIAKAKGRSAKYTEL